MASADPSRVALMPRWWPPNCTSKASVSDGQPPPRTYSLCCDRRGCLVLLKRGAVNRTPTPLRVSLRATLVLSGRRLFPAGGRDEVTKPRRLTET